MRQTNIINPFGWCIGTLLAYSLVCLFLVYYCSTPQITKELFVSPSAETRVPGFKLTDIASSLLIITQSKKGQVKGKKWTCMLNTNIHIVFCTHSHLLHSSTEALERLKSMLQLDLVPSHLAITRLVQALGSHGNVEGIQDVESLIKSLGISPNLSSMVFVNNTALAHIKK